MDRRAIRDTLKDNLILRVLAAPYKRYTYKKIYQEYINSEEPERIRLFKNCNEGKRCFIIGNGPSLRVEDLNKIKAEITIASNRIWNIFDKTNWRPTYYFFTDDRAINELLPYIEQMNLPYKFISYNAKKYETKTYSDIYHIMRSGYKIMSYNDKSVHISEDVSKYFYSCGTVLFTAVQFAIYTGVKEIYLLGVDFNYSRVINKWGFTKKVDGVTDYYDGKSYSGSRLVYYSVLYAWQAAKKYCDEHGIKIYNATRGGKLEVFERIDFDSLFE